MDLYILYAFMQFAPVLFILIIMFIIAFEYETNDVFIRKRLDIMCDFFGYANLSINSQWYECINGSSALHSLKILNGTVIYG